MHLSKFFSPMHVSDFTVINWPLLEAVELEEMTVKGDVADEMKGLAGKSASGRRKDWVAAAFEATSRPRDSVRIVCLN